MARIDAGQLKLVPHDTDLGGALSAVPENWTELARDKGLAFTHYIDPEISRHHVDEERIVQSINILLANAMSFTDSGRVHLHVTASKTNLSNLSPSEMTVVVADTGQGMSELVQSRLFTPFMQADTSKKRTHMGTGLNLAIAYALVEMMGGKLSCISREGRGSEFTFYIPLKDAISALQADKLVDIDTPAELPVATDIPVAADINVDKILQDIGVEEFEVEALAQDDDAKRASPAQLHPVESDFDAETTALEALLLDLPDLPEGDVAGSIVEDPVAEEPIAEEIGLSEPDFVDLMKPSPTRTALHQPAEHHALKSLSTPSRQRVLIVDDMDSNRDVLRMILESKDHICGEAADGFAALAELERKPYDFIILDIHMAPLDGIETLKRLRASEKSYANIPVIALTADNAPSTNAECIEAGANLFMTKPVLRDELLWSMEYLVNADSARILSQRAS